MGEQGRLNKVQVDKPVQQFIVEYVYTIYSKCEESTLSKNGFSHVKSRVKQESPLPLTDPRDAVAQRMLNIPYHIIL